MKANYSIAEIWEQMFSEEVRSVNFSDLSERFHNYEITKFDKNTTKDEWYTQYKFGCLMFALVNGNFEKDILARYLKKNETLRSSKGDFSRFRFIKAFVYEYKAILLWYKMSKNNVLGSSLKATSKMIKNMLSLNTITEAGKYAQYVYEQFDNYENRFSIKVKNRKEKNFADGEWTFNNHKVMKLDNTKGLHPSEYLKLKVRLLKCLPKYSLYCKSDHWIVFLGCEGNNMVFYDSENPSDLQRFAIGKIVRNVNSVLIK